MNRRELATLFAVVVCGACGEKAGTSKVTTPAPPTSDTTQPPPSADAECSQDADCQLLSSCDCDRCIVSKQMHVDPCAQPCGKDPCAGFAASCLAGKCVRKASTAAMACTKDADCSPPPCGPCTSGTTITPDMMMHECVVNPCKSSGAACASGVCVIR